MENKQIWTIIGVSLVVALITSIATINMTGNLVKVPTYIATTQADVYTKAEVDAKFSQVGPGVLTQFKNQIIKSPTSYNGTETNCNDICGAGYTCVNAIIKLLRDINHGSYTDRFSQESFISCNQKVRVGRVQTLEEIQDYDLSCACR